jgi:GTP-binding protein
MRKPIVSIIGQTNVGKSTLFNAIMRKNIAIVEEYPGITRDRIYGNFNCKDREFILIDTGGLTFDKKDEIKIKIAKQVFFSISESDIIIFVVNGRMGITPLDTQIAEILRKSELPVIVAVNKIDSKELKNRIYEFTKFGFTIVISGTTRS